MENRTEERRNIVRTCRDVTRKARVHLELNLARNIKESKEGFFKYISDKRKTRKCGFIAEWGGFSGDEGKHGVIECLPCFRRPALRNSRCWRKERKSCLLPLLKEDQDRDYLGKLDTHKSMVSNGVQPLGAEGAGRCHCYATLHHLWKVKENRGGAWGLRKARVTAVFTKGKMEDPSN